MNDGMRRSPSTPSNINDDEMSERKRATRRNQQTTKETCNEAMIATNMQMQQQRATNERHEPSQVFKNTRHKVNPTTTYFTVGRGVGVTVSDEEYEATQHPLITPNTCVRPKV